MAYTVEQLEKAGGKLWEKGEMRRVYFNATELERHFGLEIHTYNTGNISSAKLDGEKISNSQASKHANALHLGKLWYDLVAGKWMQQGLEGYAKDIIESIKSEIEEA